MLGIYCLFCSQKLAAVTDPVYLVPAPLSEPYCQSSSSKTKSLVTQAQSELLGVPSTSKVGLNNILIDISDSESGINEPVQSCTSQLVKKEKASESIIPKEKAPEDCFSSKNSEISIADDIEILFDKKEKVREGEALEEPTKSSIINYCRSSVDLPGSSRAVVINDKNKECCNDDLQKNLCKELLESTKPHDNSSIIVNDKNNECTYDVLQKNLCEELLQSTKLLDSSRGKVNDKNIECSNDVSQNNPCKELLQSTKLPDSSRVEINDKNNECSNGVSQNILCKEKELSQSTNLDNSSFGANSRPGNVIEEIIIDSDGETHISLNESVNEGSSEIKTTSLRNSAMNNKNQIRTNIFTLAPHASKTYDENLKIVPEICEKIPEDVKDIVKTGGKWSIHA